jgi:hypothetical protein
MAAQRMADALNRSSFWLMNELDFPLISESLIEENVISRNEAEIMDAIKMRREQNKQFVDLLKNKSPHVFKKFMFVLQTAQPHLHEIISRTSDNFTGNKLKRSTHSIHCIV